MTASLALQTPVFTRGKSFAGHHSKAIDSAMSKAAPIASTAAAPENADYNRLLTLVGQARDKDAFVTLFKYFAPRVKSYLMKNGASESLAEEIVQNTFVTVWEKAAQYDAARAAASTWIFTVARNKRIDILRHEKFIEPSDEDNSVLENIAAPTPDVYAETSTVAQLTDAIQSLPPQQAELLRMAFFEDKSHQAISKETRLPLGTVKSRLRLAMNKLREKLTRAKE
jgi:RNA polymerase sigma-70 factor (ECF subfamily)